MSNADGKDVTNFFAKMKLSEDFDPNNPNHVNRICDMIIDKMQKKSKSWFQLDMDHRTIDVPKYVSLYTHVQYRSNLRCVKQAKPIPSPGEQTVSEKTSPAKSTRSKNQSGQ